MSLSNFYPGTTKAFTISILQNGVAPDITGDTVTLKVKNDEDDTDLDAVLDEDADVITEGASGNALFELTPIKTDLPVGEYFYDILWATSGGQKYILLSGVVRVLKRVSDV